VGYQLFCHTRCCGQASRDFKKTARPSELPKNAKSLLGTPRSTKDLIKTLAGGEFWYGGILCGLKSRLTFGDFRKIFQQEVVIDVFVDGISP